MARRSTMFKAPLTNFHFIGAHRNLVIYSKILTIWYKWKYP